MPPPQAAPAPAPGPHFPQPAPPVHQQQPQLHYQAPAGPQPPHAPPSGQPAPPYNPAPLPQQPFHQQPSPHHMPPTAQPAQAVPNGTYSAPYGDLHEFAVSRGALQLIRCLCMALRISVKRHSCIDWKRVEASCLVEKAYHLCMSRYQTRAVVICD